MASKLITLPCKVIFFVAVYFTGALAQSSCTSELMSLSPCLNYVTGNTSTPSSSCCMQLASVVNSQPRCLCLLLNGGTSSVGITVNQTRALALPDACSVQTPPVSRCNAGNGQTSPGTASSPEGAPANSSNKTPETPKTDVPAGGSKSVPSTVDSSAGGNIKVSIQLLSFLLFIASYALAPPAF